MVGVASLAKEMRHHDVESAHAVAHAVGPMFKIQFLLAPTLSLATMPRPLSTCIRFRLAPIFCFAAYQFNGNSPSSDKVCTDLLCRC